MAHLRDDSLLFSLNRLFDDEKERVLNEQRAREQRISAEAEARAADERRRQEAELKRQAEEERRRCAELQRQREEAMRLEALKTAELQRVRAEVQNKNQLEQAALDHQHQLKMAALTHELRFRHQRWFVAGSLLLACGLLTFGIAAYYGKLRPEQARMVASYEDTLTSERARLAEAQRRLAELERDRAAMQTRCQALQGRTKQDVKKLAPQSPPARPAVTGPRHRTRGMREATPGKALDPNDPLNPTLGD